MASIGERSVEKYGADDLSRTLSAKRQLIALLFGQLSGATSLREVVTGLRATKHGFITWERRR